MIDGGRKSELSADKRFQMHSYASSLLLCAVSSGRECTAKSTPGPDCETMPLFVFAFISQNPDVSLSVDGRKWEYIGSLTLRACSPALSLPLSLLVAAGTLDQDCVMLVNFQEDIP